MRYIITSECVNCRECLDICPVSAIIEGEDQLFITDACVCCGKCVEVCPVEAIRINNQK